MEIFDQIGSGNPSRKKGKAPFLRFPRGWSSFKWPKDSIPNLICFLYDRACVRVCSWGCCVSKQKWNQTCLVDSQVMILTLGEENKSSAFIVRTGRSAKRARKRKSRLFNEKTIFCLSYHVGSAIREHCTPCATLTTRHCRLLQIKRDDREKDSSAFDVPNGARKSKCTSFRPQNGAHFSKCYDHWIHCLSPFRQSAIQSLVSLARNEASVELRWVTSGLDRKLVLSEIKLLRFDASSQLSSFLVVLIKILSLCSCERKIHRRPQTDLWTNKSTDLRSPFFECTFVIKSDH